MVVSKFECRLCHGIDLVMTTDQFRDHVKQCPRKMEERNKAAKERAKKEKAEKEKETKEAQKKGNQGRGGKGKKHK